ncbi:MAG: hydrogenase maturation nickel metallochaperone HypA [Actinomycetota bacterium]|nr:hydrogenase maturation nickel metallochaperone HypA [Actinomycetota bacterium]
MHEYSITCSVVEILKEKIEEHDIKKVKKINFEVNPLAYIEPESVEFYYDFLTRDVYSLKSAVLNFSKKEVIMKCMSCGKTFKTEDFNSRCIYCSSDDTRVIKKDDGENIKIVSIET